MRRMTTSKKAPDVAERLKAARAGRGLTVAELARLWWPETPTGKGRKAVEGRYFAAMAANKRLKMMVTAGLLEVSTRPHPTRRQEVMHARRVLTWADRGRWMVGELA